MGTGIYRLGIVGLEEISQENIDFWCNRCQFPILPEKCKTKNLVQMCWDGARFSAATWHQRHECPFKHVGKACRCNDFKDRADAFRAVGLEYKPPPE